MRVGRVARRAANDDTSLLAGVAGVNVSSDDGHRLPSPFRLA